jgi:hypothetical protein
VSAPDFTFDLTRAATEDELRPLYSHIFSYKVDKPVVSFGADADPAAARQWLIDNHKAYADRVGKRSHLVRNLKLEDMVELTDLKATP